MILQALHSYYKRLADDPEEDVPRPGYSREKIHFALVLSPNGKLLAVDDLREKQGKKTLPREMIVPRARAKPTSSIGADFFWDNSGYVLGADAKDNPKRAEKCFNAFKKVIKTAMVELEAGNDLGLAAVRAFLEAWNPATAPECIGKFKPWKEVARGNLIFRLDGDQMYIHERPAVQAAWELLRVTFSQDERAFCLVTGEEAPIARLHLPVGEVPGTELPRVPLVSFNQDAFTSYGKQKSYNAPVSEAAAFAYATALNHLLRPGSRRRVQMADATTVFWSEKPSELEDLLGLFMESKQDEEDKGGPADDGGIAQKVRAILKAVREGRMPPELGETKTAFYILGLAPNAARLSVRFFEVSTTGEMAARVGRHFRDIAIERRSPKEPEFPGMWQLLIELAPLRKSENIPSVLGGALMRAILGGRPYPRSLLTSIIGRIRADHEVSYLKAALIKAYFNRLARFANEKEVVTVALDPTCENIGYLMGRLFAVLEKAQQDALPGIKASIRDRFFGAASATPRAVFPRLIHLAQYHLSKAEYGHVTDRLLAKVTEKIDASGIGFPAHLSLEDQGMFALGYYHQRNDNYRKNEDKLDPIKEN